MLSTVQSSTYTLYTQTTPTTTSYVSHRRQKGPYSVHEKIVARNTIARATQPSTRICTTISTSIHIYYARSAKHVRTYLVVYILEQKKENKLNEDEPATDNSTTTYHYCLLQACRTNSSTCVRAYNTRDDQNQISHLIILAFGARSTYYWQ